MPRLKRVEIVTTDKAKLSFEKKKEQKYFEIDCIDLTKCANYRIKALIRYRYLNCKMIKDTSAKTLPDKIIF